MFGRHLFSSTGNTAERMEDNSARNGIVVFRDKFCDINKTRERRLTCDSDTLYNNLLSVL